MVSRSRMWADDTLRKAGFAVVSRPAAGPVLWRRRGHVSVLPQGLALELVAMERKRAAEAAALEAVNK